jgi:processing peptidase subunit beta
VKVVEDNLLKLLTKYWSRLQRENTVYYAKAFNNDVPKAVDILADILLGAEDGASKGLGLVSGGVKVVEDNLLKLLVNLLLTAWSWSVLVAFPTSSSWDSPRSTSVTSPASPLPPLPYNSLGDQSGEVVIILPANTLDGESNVSGGDGVVAEFIGSEVRLRDDTIPSAHIALAVEGVSWKDDDYFCSWGMPPAPTRTMRSAV